MMDYDVFKKVVSARIKEFLPPVYAKFDVSMASVPKINGMREAMVVAMESEGCRMSGPNIYMDDMYEYFNQCNDIEIVLSDIADMILEFTGTQRLDRGDAISMDAYSEYIVHMLINTEMNQELLEKAPHRDFFDLSVIYRLAVPDADGHGYATALITYELMDELGVTAEELDAMAEKNSRRNLKTQLFPMSPELTMMTTEAKMYGAINLLRLDEIRKVSEKMDADLYLLPSSVHDLMVMRDNELNSEENLFALLRDGNEKCNEADENLSYNIYYYDRKTDSLTIRYWDK